MRRAIFFIFLLSVYMGAREWDFGQLNTPLHLKKIDAKELKRCRCVCQKQLRRAQRMQRALDYYKHSSYYTFSSKNLSR